MKIPHAPLAKGDLMHRAHLVEIFSSVQGEGLYVGEPMTFVRFGRCNMKCLFCDTPQGICHQESCRVEDPPRSGSFVEIANPVGVTRLCEIMHAFEDEIVSITGGEPLEQAEVLAEWLPTLATRRKILLETNGTHPQGLMAILPFVHVISMDIKLPSSTGCDGKWAEHAAFLQAAVTSGRELYVKLVVTEKTTDLDLQQAIAIITRANRYIPVVIQPASPTLGFLQVISKDRLRSVERLCSAYLDDVRVIRQMHKEWGVR